MAKPDLALILGPKPKGGESEGGMIADIPPRFAECADQAFDAVKKGDREAFASALFDCIEAHNEPPPEDDTEEPGEEEME